METYKREVTREDDELLKYVEQRESYSKKAKPLVKKVEKNQAKIQKVIDNSKKKIEALKEETEGYNQALIELGMEFQPIKEDIQELFEEVEFELQAHEYEYLESVDIKKGKLVVTMVDAPEQAKQNAMKSIDEARKS